jgi:hypothetical protein
MASPPRCCRPAEHPTSSAPPPGRAPPPYACTPRQWTHFPPSLKGMLPLWPREPTTLEAELPIKSCAHCLPSLPPRGRPDLGRAGVEGFPPAPTPPSGSGRGPRPAPPYAHRAANPASSRSKRAASSQKGEWPTPS